MDREFLKKLRNDAVESLENATSLKELDEVRIEYLGRKGKLADTFKSLASLSVEEKRKFGPALNSLKEELLRLFEKRKSFFEHESGVGFDITKPGKNITRGRKHPLSLVEEEVREIFVSLNFSVVDGPESEIEKYNFDALNIPADHPARDEWDTFWIKESENSKLHNKNRKFLMRTHTSPVQVRYMEKNNPPFRIIVPGRVFRYEATDASHEINFYQVEGLMVGPDVTLSNLKYIIETFLKRLFKKNIEFRFRPSYFPFTEPSLEVDIKLDGKWLEVMGAGMVHRKVFDAVGYNPEDVQGFAFGVGLDRLAMIKYKIPDVRLFYSGDLRFIKQF